LGDRLTLVGRLTNHGEQINAKGRYLKEKIRKERRESR